MKKVLLSMSLFATISFGWAQTQIGNSGFENWEAVAGNQEPVNWNSFLTASGPGWITAFATNQVASSTDVRPGTSGSSSCRIWSTNPIGSTIANGNVTIGRINMGNVTPASVDNYNHSVISDPNFSEAITDSPDSIVFWAKFDPINASETARMKATLHDSYNYRDPEDATALQHVVATVDTNFVQATPVWRRYSCAFDYSGPASGPQFILVTFTTNATPGGGDDNDQLWIDDVELIYNPVSIKENTESNVVAFFTNSGDQLNFKADSAVQFEVYDMTGKQIVSGEGTSVEFNYPKGAYIVKTSLNGQTGTTKVIKY